MKKTASILLLKSPPQSEIVKVNGTEEEVVMLV